MAEIDIVIDAAPVDIEVSAAQGPSSQTFLINKATIADSDKIALLDSAASDAPKHGLWSLVKSTLKTYFDTLYAAALGADDNYVTDAEKTVIGNTSGTNTGDEDAASIAAALGYTPVNPSSLGTASAADAGDFATSAQGALAASALQSINSSLVETALGYTPADAASTVSSDIVQAGGGVAITNVVAITTAAYDDLVLAATVDPNTHYLFLD